MSSDVRDIAQEYMRILAQHGRRIANRYLVAAGHYTGLTLTDFYAQYGSEATLPEHERSRSDLVHRFDPGGYLALYEGVPVGKKHEAPPAAVEPARPPEARTLH
ncbi:hypothetical protein [Cupriavidus sp. TMH.W2]|uniref:hypothetical protein n=1 Tax=Cupriavidus sp. TMH.W2 TaxID=3434465 RepID=UPI003D7715A1